MIFALFMTDFFDTIGTAVAVGTRRRPARRAGPAAGIAQLLLVDSAAAAVGGAMGVSSVTTYVESGAGVAEGARTGLASLVTAGLFALTIFFVPLIALVGQEVPSARTTFTPAVAPALVMVGYLMIRLVADIDWSRPEDALPAFLMIAGIPLTFSIAAGIGFGVIGYVVVMAAHRPGPRGPPADVGARAAVPRLLRRGLADGERVLRAALRVVPRCARRASRGTLLACRATPIPPSASATCTCAWRTSTAPSRSTAMRSASAVVDGARGVDVVFLAAGDYRRRVALNTFETRRRPPPPRGHTGLHTSRSCSRPVGSPGVCGA